MHTEKRRPVALVRYRQQHAKPLPIGDGLGSGGWFPLQEVCQRHCGRMPEQGRDGNLPADADAKPGDGLDGLERLPSKIEEIILDREFPHPKDLLPDGQYLALHRRGCGRWLRRFGDRHTLQSGAVDLAVSVAGQPVQKPQIRWDHAGRQNSVELPPQGSRGWLGFIDDKPS
jgi:hypothetical protein